MATPIRLLYVTTKNPEQAREIARPLLEERLVACVNILPGMESMYWWDGRIQSDAEAVMVLKTQEKNVAAVTARILELHSYDCPCVLSLSIESGHGPYLDWLMRESTVRP